MESLPTDFHWEFVLDFITDCTHSLFGQCNTDDIRSCGRYEGERVRCTITLPTESQYRSPNAASILIKTATPGMHDIVLWHTPTIFVSQGSLQTILTPTQTRMAVSCEPRTAAALVTSSGVGALADLPA